MATPRDFAKYFSLTESRNVHDSVRQWLIELGNAAANAATPKHDSWQKVEQTNRVFVDADAVDSNGQARVNEDTRFVIPWARSIRDTILTSIWLPWADRSPIVPLTGQGPEDVIRAQLMAHHLDWQLNQRNGLLTIYNQQADAVDYGFGAAETRWVEDRRNVWRANGGQMEMVSEDLYVGNETRNLDPYRCLKDPHVPAGRHQDGRFFGYSYDASGAEVDRLAARSDQYGRGWINTDKIEEGSVALRQEPFLFGSRDRSVRNRVQGLADPGETLTEGIDFGSNVPAKEKEVNFHIVTIMEVWVVPARNILPYVEKQGSRVPSEHWLRSTDQQLWRFTMLDGKWIVDVEPQDQLEFSFHVSEPHPDLRSTYCPGVVEMMLDLQEHIDWTFRTHVAAVETGLNGIRIIDESALDVNDFIEEGNGVLAALKPEAYGRDPRTTIYDIPWQDYTQQNLNDIQILADIMQRQTGSTDGNMGMVSPGRRSATDVSNASQHAYGRMRMLSQHITLTGLNPGFKLMVWNTQRRERAEHWFKVNGELEKMFRGENAFMGAEAQPGFVKVTPDMIQGKFDVGVMDGRPQPESAAIGQNILTLLRVLSPIPNMIVPQQPGMPTRIDPMKLIRWFATSQGLKNFSDAEMSPDRITPELMAQQDEQILEQEQAGNLVAPEQRIGR